MGAHTAELAHLGREQQRLLQPLAKFKGEQQQQRLGFAWFDADQVIAETKQGLVVGRHPHR